MTGFNKFFKDGTGGLRGGANNATKAFESSERRISYWDDSIPVGYWDMSDGSGTEVSDVSSAGNNLDGTGYADVHSSPAWDSTNKVRGSYSLNFDKDDEDRVIVADDSALDFNVDDEFSISCWIKKTSADPSGETFAGLVSKMSQTAVTDSGDSAFDGYSFYMDASTQQQPRFVLVVASEVLRVAGGDADEIADTDWHHLVVTYNGNAALNGVKMYLDSAALSMSQVEDSLETDDDMLTSADMSFGAFINNPNATPASIFWHFHGNMDEIAIWDKELSSDEIDDLYNSGDGNDLTNGIPK